MPRRGNGNGNKNRQEWRQNDRNNYDEHDDRDRKPATQRRVSFKPSSLGHSSGGGILKARIAELAIRSHLNEDDDVMGGNINDRTGGQGFSKFNRNRRKGSPIPRGKTMFGKRFQNSTTGWYQVTIPYGQKYHKDDILRYLLNVISPEIFIPHYWKQEKTCVIFYVDDVKIAEKLKQADRTIQMPNGFKLQIRVHSASPTVNIDDEYKERMKMVMAKRYNAKTKALDLSKFHADSDFKDVFCALFRQQILTAAIDIIATNIPDLEALNLNDNQLIYLDSFKNVSQKIPNLKILYMSDNRIHSCGSLGVFRGVPLVELILTGNPISTRFNNHAQYVSEIRRKFPKLVKLDGQMLEPQISFDVAENTSLPKPEASFFCNTEGIDIIREFLKQYFIIYDSGNRQPLLDAYHEQAMLSLSCPLGSQGARLSNYFQYSRNLLRSQYDHDVKYRCLKNGRLPVVSFLSELPKTTHDLMSFSVDLTIFNPQLITFTVTGLFKEIDPSNSSHQSEIRSFQRFFMIVPGTSGGFCIRNEMILIANPTAVQIRNAFKESTLEVSNPVQQRLGQQHQSIPSTSQQLPQQLSQQLPQQLSQQLPQQLPQQPPQQQNVIQAQELNDTVKLQMIQAMSAQSNMNLDWSKKCLEETNWDFNHASFVFDKLNKESKIPPEAFIK